MKKFSVKIFLFWVFIGIVFILNSPLLYAMENEECLECHTQEDVDMPFVRQEILKKSVHRDLSCIDCHSDIEDVPHKKRNTIPQCNNCHEEEYEVYKKSIHFSMEEGPAKCWDCHGRHNILSSKDSKSLIYKTKIVDTCARCHADEKVIKKFDIPMPNIVQSYKQSVHYLSAKEKGLVVTATCIDCHGGHNIYPPDNPESTIFKKNIPKTCGPCHDKIYREFSRSVHGKKLARGILRSPACTDCHGEHLIRPHTDEESAVYPANIPRYTCRQCHGLKELNVRYGLPSDRVETYMQSYHGLALSMGDYTTANCASCHGVHNILPSSDPDSLIHPQNLPKTCGQSQCHPNATVSFARGSIHISRRKLETNILELIRWFYIMLIIGTIGGMIFHNGLDYLKKLREHYAKHTYASNVERFNLSMRVQHFLLVFSFVILAVTGFALKYPDQWWVKPFRLIEGGAQLRALIHRIAGGVFVFTCIYHLYFLIFTKRGRYELKQMLPKFKDVTDTFYSMMYLIGLKEKRPSFYKYSYIEKAEYWTLIWGAFIMILTGSLLWFENFSMNLLGLPKWLLDVAELIHFYEAILATLAIIVWHLYHVVKEINLFRRVKIVMGPP